ncbi:cytochrome b [Thalassotalea mangrovi]|nr:cytochrome b [Thalassotalea mangrovi]
MKDMKAQLSKTTLTLHWLVGVTVILLLIVGFYMDAAKARELYPIHKSIGMLVLVLAVVRILWRIRQGWPQPLTDNLLQIGLARIAHWILITVTIIMPVSGMVMSAMGGHGLILFGWELVAANPDPNNLEKVIAVDKGLAKLAKSVHESCAYIAALIVTIHILASLYHHLLKKDGTLERMLGKKVE